MPSGLGHFKNSRVGMGLMEPLYLNQFEVTIIPPASISANRDLLLQEIQKVEGLDVEQVPSELKIQQFKTSTRPFAGAKPEKTHLELKLSFNVNLSNANSALTYKILRSWCDIVRNPLTGEMGLLADMTDGGNTKIIVNCFNKRGDIYRTITGYNVFPAQGALSTLNLDYTADEIYKIEGFGLVCQYFDDISI